MFLLPLPSSVIIYMFLQSNDFVCHSCVCVCVSMSVCVCVHVKYVCVFFPRSLKVLPMSIVMVVGVVAGVVVGLDCKSMVLLR